MPAESGVALGRNRQPGNSWLSVRGAVIGRGSQRVRNEYTEGTRLKWRCSNDQG